MGQLDLLLIIIMNKEKLIKGVIWFSFFSLSVILSAVCLFIGFNNQRYGNNTILIIGLLLLPVVFVCAYKGIKLLLSAIFD